MLRAGRAVPRTALTFGTVVLAPVDFSDRDGWKTRPAVVVSVDRDDVVRLAPIYTTRSGGRGDLAVGDWQVAGLTRPSRIGSDVAETERREVRVVLGHLSREDETSFSLLLNAMDC